ncbi:MAG: hypothetical protein ACRDRK_16820 [Pseudonocardia sp.]
MGGRPADGVQCLHGVNLDVDIGRVPASGLGDGLLQAATPPLVGEDVGSEPVPRATLVRRQRQRRDQLMRAQQDELDRHPPLRGERSPPDDLLVPASLRRRPGLGVAGGQVDRQRHVVAREVGFAL